MKLRLVHIAALLIGIAETAIGGAFDYRFTQFDASGTVNTIQNATVPPLTEHGIFGHDGTRGPNGRPTVMRFGANPDLAFDPANGEIRLSADFYSRQATAIATGSTPGPQGPAGATGANGLSAYDIAVQQGYSGNLSAWLASLQGAVGATGATGPTGPAGTTDWAGITNRPTTLSGFGITDPVLLTSGSYSDPAWLTGIAWSKVTGAPSFITGITGSMVTTALGGTPLLSEVDGSTTNEIELPSQSGQSGKVLSTNGSAASWAAPSSMIGDASSSAPGLMTAADKQKMDSYPAYAARVFNNAPGRSIVTAAAAANGFQVDGSRDSFVSYSITISSTVSLSGNQTGYVVLELNPTNATTGWVEVARVSSGQSGTLVVGLTLNQTGGGGVTAMVPAGHYARIRSVNTAGTPTYALNGCQETKL